MYRIFTLYRKKKSISTGVCRIEKENYISEKSGLEECCATCHNLAPPKEKKKKQKTNQATIVTKESTTQGKVMSFKGGKHKESTETCERLQRLKDNQKP